MDLNSKIVMEKSKETLHDNDDVKGEIRITPSKNIIKGIVGEKTFYEATVINGLGLLQINQEVLFNFQNAITGLSFEPFSALRGTLVEASSTMAKIKTNDEGAIGLLLTIAEVDSTFLPQNQYLVASTFIRDTQAPYADVKIEAKASIRFFPK